MSARNYDYLENSHSCVYINDWKPFKLKNKFISLEVKFVNRHEIEHNDGQQKSRILYCGTFLRISHETLD